ncbi:hypothetical protein DV735_g1411, partial [Chaetothyriales sp. CBS 134920]
MMRTVYDMTSARLNSIMPTLQQMEDDPAFQEYRERRFQRDDPPPAYSSHTTTRASTPQQLPQTQADIDLNELLARPLSDREINVLRDMFKSYYPRGRYQQELRMEEARVFEAGSTRDENYVSLYRGPDLIGRAGMQRAEIMARHSVKKRWEKLGVWNPEWGFKDGPGSWSWDRKWRGIKRKFNCLELEEEMASWPSEDEESPNERAIRLYLQREGRWSNTLKVVSSGAGNIYNTETIDDREALITSRPWFVWALEAAEEEVKQMRDPKQFMIEAYKPARAIVTARWKEKGWWKDSWSRKIPEGGGIKRDLVGWKWRHESPSPEPPDLNEPDFTPSEADAMEAIPPPTPPPPPKPLKARPPTWSIFGYTPGYDPDAPEQQEEQEPPIPAPGSDENEPGSDSRPARQQAFAVVISAPRPRPPRSTADVNEGEISVSFFS